MKNGNETPDLRGLKRIQACCTEKTEQHIQGAAVIRERRGGKPARMLQRMEIVARQPGIRMRAHGRYSRALTPAAHSSPMRLR